MTGVDPKPEAPGQQYCPHCERSYDEAVETCPQDGTRLISLAPPDPFIGQDLAGRFTVREHLGAGGMGSVYVGWQHSIGREVAIKVIERRLAREPMWVRRFLREAKLASQLAHPNTVSVLDFGQTGDGTLFLVMELLRGRTLDRVLADEGALPYERLVKVAAQLCDALGAAHALGIVHRDLKPANVMLLGQDLVKVLDFGLAKSITAEDSASTVSGKLVGTPRYMAPEVILGGEANDLSDLYSLGVVMHELVTGRPFVDAKHSAAVLSLQVHGEPDPLPDHVPEPLRALIARLLEKAPTCRCQSASEARAVLEELRALGPRSSSRQVAVPADVRDAPTRAETPRGKAPRPRRRPRLVAGALGLTVLLAAGLLALTARPPPPAAPARAPAAAPPDAAPAPPPPDAAAPAAALVELRFETRPPGAEVRLGGVHIGRTPLVRAVPRSGEEIVVELLRPGYRAVTRRVVPDMTRTVQATLERAARPASKLPF